MAAHEEGDVLCFPSIRHLMVLAAEEKAPDVSRLKVNSSQNTERSGQEQGRQGLAPL